MQDKKIYYKLDRRSRRITYILMAVFAALIIAFYFFGDSGLYLPGWFLLTVSCVIILCILSIPRYIKLSKDAFEIHCILDMTRIHIEDIEVVRLLGADEEKGWLPLFASWGFFGYFGYFFTIKEWDLYRVYTSARTNRILIEDIYEVSYVVNCDDPEGLIDAIIEARNEKRQEIFRHI